MKQPVVFISDKLKKGFNAFYRNLDEILRRNKYQFEEIPSTKDIWCRDYMPVVGANRQLVRYTYWPTYLIEDKNLKKSITDVDEILNPEEWKYLKSDIILDGGAIEIFQNQGIISDRVFRDNSKNDEIELLTIIKRLLGLNRLTVVPQHPDDFTGHVDGLVRFVDSSTVLVNDLSNEEPEEWVYGFKMALYNAGYNMEILPYRAYNNNEDDAKGIYMNFLKLPELIIMPIFTFEKEDEAAKNKLAHVFPGRLIETIYSTDLAKKGGIVNCVTWTKE